jgi:hypothetical protein
MTIHLRFLSHRNPSSIVRAYLDYCSSEAVSPVSGRDCSRSEPGSNARETIAGFQPLADVGGSGLGGNKPNPNLNVRFPALN